MQDTGNGPSERRERISLRIPVELGEGDFADPFEASTLNVSKGGISMRAACLPDPGSQLLCRFRCTPSGAEITARGEVVWVHLDDEQSGEFGLSFVDLDPQSEWLIEEMLAEHAVAQGHEPEREAVAKVAQLVLEGSGEAISARVARQDGQTVVFEQPLDLLSVGRGVRAHGAGEVGRAGSIARVELRMVGSVPMLAVTVAFDGRALDVGVFEGRALVPAPIAKAEPTSEHDTAPDLQAPELVTPASREPAQRSTLLEFEAQRGPERAAPIESSAPVAHSDTAAGESDAHVRPTANPALDAAAAAAAEYVDEYEQQHEHEDEPSVAPQRSAAHPASQQPASQQPASQQPASQQPASQQPASQQPASQQPAEPAARMPVGEAREASISFAVPRIDPQDEAELMAMFGRESSAAERLLQRAAALGREHGGRVWRAALAALQVGMKKAAPELRAAWLRALAVARVFYGQRVAPQLGTLRRLAAARVATQRRRTTTAPAAAVAAEPERSGLARTLLLGVIAAAAIAMAVYAFAPTGDDDALPLHRPVQANPAAAASAPAAAPAASSASLQPGSAPSFVAPDPAAVPSASSVPASSPFAIDVRDRSAVRTAAAAPKPAAGAVPTARATGAPASSRSLRFGAASVPAAKRFTLRMSSRVLVLTGAADDGGFTVVATGGLALDRAGPISSSHAAVKRAMIINKGDRAELTIRFADGKHPAYQVTAEGSTLQLAIQEL